MRETGSHSPSQSDHTPARHQGRHSSGLSGLSGRDKIKLQTLDIFQPVYRKLKGRAREEKKEKCVKWEGGKRGGVEGYLYHYLSRPGTLSPVSSHRSLLPSHPHTCRPRVLPAADNPRDLHIPGRSPPVSSGVRSIPADRCKTR